ncbi:MAG: hypothetical protein QOF85_1480 [Solirubrobacterales bacterium]|jgi:hypothetical protein|nr:hypothetical protein [Solirubrobacterales bacterium]
MSLDGLRAWIGVVERKLTMRTRVFLVLVAIAIGGAGAGIYLGANAQTDKVSEADLRSLQEELTGKIEVLESWVETLEASEIPAPLPEPGVEKKGSGGTKPK